MKLSAHQRDILQDCFKRERNNEDPCTDKLIKTAPELVINGYLELKLHTLKNGGRKVSYFITNKGKEKILEIDKVKKEILSDFASL